MESPRKGRHSLTEDANQPESLVRKPFGAPIQLLAFAAIIIVNLLCYWRTLNGYFLADDFVHVAYLADVFNGHQLKLLENFTGNWMHAWGTQFYRPFISLTLAWDYMLGGGSALAFHISNTIFQIVSSLFLYLISIKLMPDFAAKQRFICALTAGIFFAACPFHTEVVSWIIGRVDSVCLSFFLAAFYLHLCYEESKKRKLFIASLFCFIISLISKEMAVTLPPLIVLSSLFLSKESAVKAKIASCVKASLPYWIIFLGYMCVRTLALGTVAGGYSGSIGEGLSGSALERFKSAIKMIFPFNNEVIAPFDKLRKHLLNLYKITAFFLSLSLVLFRIAGQQLKLAGFCLVWILLSLVPTYQVFNITDSLMCSRFAYFASAPFCLLLAVLLSPLWAEQKNARLKSISLWMERLSIVLIALFVFVFCSITIKNNNAWAHAGSQVREFRAALADACSKLNSKNKIILLNVPQRLEGAHMIYNGAMLSVLLSEPLSKPPIASRVASFEPPTYGDAELINISRLREMIKSNPADLVCFWDMNSKRLVTLKPEKHLYDLSAEPSNKLLEEENESGKTFTYPGLDIDASSADFIVCSLGLSADKQKEVPITLYWSSSNFPDLSFAHSITLNAQSDGKIHEYYFPVSEHKSWIESGRITHVQVKIPKEFAGSSIQTNKEQVRIKIISAQDIMPVFTASKGQLAEGLDGIDRMAGDSFSLHCDASKIPNCKKIAVELSRPSCWYEHYAGTFREKNFSKETLKKFEKPGNQADFEFTKKDFPQAAYYELRAFALDENGKIIGFCSDPINLQID